MVKRTRKDSVDVNNAKKSKLESVLVEEENSKALSKQKVVYSRKEEPDTVIVRDVVAEKWNAFGVKGEIAVKNLFHAIVKLLDENRSSLNDLKFGVGEKLINIINASMIGNEINAIRVIDNEDGVRKQCIDVNENIRVNFVMNGKKAIQVALLNLEKNDDDLHAKVSTGIYLFLSECEKLLRYMNEHFKIVNGHEAKDEDKQEEKTLKSIVNDYFF